MGKLNAGQCIGRGPEWLEASHTGASTFYRSMILLDKIVEVLASPHLNVFPLWMFAPQKPKSPPKRPDENLQLNQRLNGGQGWN